MGEPAVNCINDGEEKCATCDRYYKNDGTGLCIKNDCKCTNGRAATHCESEVHETCQKCSYGYDLKDVPGTGAVCQSQSMASYCGVAEGEIPAGVLLQINVDKSNDVRDRLTPAI